MNECIGPLYVLYFPNWAHQQTDTNSQHNLYLQMAMVKGGGAIPGLGVAGVDTNYTDNRCVAASKCYEGIMPNI